MLIHERGYKCERCKNSEWMGIEINLQLEHKDGNHFNNEKTNLELLCLNCHSQTLTFNRKKTAKLISDDEFLKVLNSSKNIRQCLLKLGLQQGSTNYDRAKRLLRRNMQP